MKRGLYAPASLAGVIALGFFLAWVALALALPLAKTDPWFHLKSGQTLVEWRGFPSSDLFSYSSPKTQWLRRSWLFDLALWLLWCLGGVKALVLAKAALGVLVFSLLFLLLLQEGVPWGLTLAFCALSFEELKMFWCERPQMVACPLLVAGLAMLKRPASQARLMGLAGLTLLWANLHASVVVWVALVWIYEAAGIRAQRSWKPAALSALSTLACSLLSPSFWAEYWELPKLLTTRHFLMELVSEFRPPVWAWHGALLAMLSIALIWLLLVPNKKAGNVAAALLLGIGAMGTLRMAPFFCLAGPLLFVPDLTRVGRGLWEKLELPLMACLGAVFCCALFAGVLHAPACRFCVAEEAFPVGAADFLAANPPQGHLGNLFNDGAYLLWRLGPKVKVFVDNRLENYPDEVLKDAAILQEGGPAIWGIIGKYQMSCLLVPNQFGAAVRLLLGKGWCPAYLDPNYLILASREEGHAQQGRWHCYARFGVDPQGRLFLP